MCSWYFFDLFHGVCHVGYHPGVCLTKGRQTYRKQLLVMRVLAERRLCFCWPTSAHKRFHRKVYSYIWWKNLIYGHVYDQYHYPPLSICFYLFCPAEISLICLLYFPISLAFRALTWFNILFSLSLQILFKSYSRSSSSVWLNSPFLSFMKSLP